jgi:hypothetical protein
LTNQLISGLFLVRDAPNFRGKVFAPTYTMQDPSRGFAVGTDPLADYNPFGNPFANNQTAAASVVTSGVMFSKNFVYF